MDDCYRAHAHDVMAAILVFQNNETESHVGEPNQSCGSSTLFLSAHFFVRIYLHDHGTRECIRSIGLVDMWFRGADAR